MLWLCCAQIAKLAPFSKHHDGLTFFLLFVGLVILYWCNKNINFTRDVRWSPCCHASLSPFWNEYWRLAQSCQTRSIDAFPWIVRGTDKNVIPIYLFIYYHDCKYPYFFHFNFVALLQCANVVNLTWQQTVIKLLIWNMWNWHEFPPVHIKYIGHDLC